MTPISVHKLINEDHELHGISRADVAAPSGSYIRREPRIVGTEFLSNSDQHKSIVSSTNQTYPTVFRIELAGAMVAGQGTVVTRSGRLLSESAAEFLNHNTAPDGFERNDNELSLIRQPVDHIDRPSLLVKRPWWRNYGHWLVDGAALLTLIPAVRMPADIQVVIGAHESKSMRNVMYDTLAKLAPNIPIVEQPDTATWAFSNLHYITPVHIPPLFKLPIAREILRAAFLRDEPISERRRRIYVSRDPQAGRAIENESEIIDICLSRGLEILRPEQYSIQGQASIFHNCEIVVGVKGAGLTNAIFAPSSLGMLVLSPGTFNDPFFWDLAGQSNMDYTEIFGPVVAPLRSAGANNFRIIASVFASELDLLIERTV